MTSTVEKGIAAYLRTVTGITCSIHEGATSLEIPVNVSIVIARVSQTTLEVGPLWYGELELVITTPAPHKTLADHEAIVAAVETALDEVNLEAISTAVESAAGYAIDGYHYHNQRSEPGNNRWSTGLSVILGLVKL
jgi:hypothetical protein